MAFWECDSEQVCVVKNANWIGYILRRNCHLKHVIEGNIEVTGRRGRRRKQLLDDFKETRRYWNLKEEALDRTFWRTCFGRGYGPVVRERLHDDDDDDDDDYDDNDDDVCLSFICVGLFSWPRHPLVLTSNTVTKYSPVPFPTTSGPHNLSRFQLSIRKPALQFTWRQESIWDIWVYMRRLHYNVS
jgi:hypothetical protein